MNKAESVAIATAAVGTAAYMAYSRMKPHAKKELKNEFRDTFHHIDNFCISVHLVRYLLQFIVINVI